MDTLVPATMIALILLAWVWDLKTQIANAQRGNIAGTNIAGGGGSVRSHPVASSRPAAGHASAPAVAKADGSRIKRSNGVPTWTIDV